MAGRWLQALSQGLNRAQNSVRSSSNGQFTSQLVDGPYSSSSLSSWWRIGNVVGMLDGCSAPASLRSFSSRANCSSGPLSAPRYESIGREGTRLLPYSTVALETREDFRSNAAEIGYSVLGPYVPDAGKIQPQAAFAVVQVGSHQFKVSPGDMIYTEKLKHADINDQLSLNKVLLLGSLKQTIIGRPVIPEAAVIAAVEEHALDAKVIVFKKKRRKNYRRTNGHRQELTRLRILHIEGIEDTSVVRGEIS